MKTIPDCWKYIFPSECDFGTYIYKNSNIELYVHGGFNLALEKKIKEIFYVHEEHGFVGHCILSFYGVKNFNINVSAYEVQNGTLKWQTPINTRYESWDYKDTKKFGLAGGVHGSLAWVDIEIEAQKFELHILEKDEPVLQGGTPFCGSMPAPVALTASTPD